MIRVIRSAEPAALATVRGSERSRVKVALDGGEPLTSKLVGTKYQCVASELRLMQWGKCCYCEYYEQEDFNDVEHYRPKAEALRGIPFGSRGYWWLAWSWENLLFACAKCNRSEKNSRFPLDLSSTPLDEAKLEEPPGTEEALILDPTGVIEPLDHIVFRPFVEGDRERWKPFPRNGSKKGSATIRDLGLGRPGLVDDYTRFVATEVRPKVAHLLDAIAFARPHLVAVEWRRLTQDLLRASCRFVGLSVDAIDHFVPQSHRKEYRLDAALSVRQLLDVEVLARQGRAST